VVGGVGGGLLILAMVTFFVVRRCHGTQTGTEETELFHSITKVIIIKQLGEGNFGQVFLGSWGSTPVISPSKIWSPSDRWL
jgi:hypothetical protein